MIWPLIGSIGGKVLDIVDDVVEDKDEANRLKFEIQRQLIEKQVKRTGSLCKDSFSGSPRFMASLLVILSLYVGPAMFLAQRKAMLW